MPWHDWQFWFVTTLTAFSAWQVARTLMPSARPRAVKRKLAALTIEGRSL